MQCIGATAKDRQDSLLPPQKQPIANEKPNAASVDEVTRKRRQLTRTGAAGGEAYPVTTDIGNSGIADNSKPREIIHSFTEARNQKKFTKNEL